MERAGGTGSGPPSPHSHGGLQHLHPYLVPGIVVIFQRGSVRLDLGKHKAVTNGHNQAGPSRMARAMQPARPWQP